MADGILREVELDAIRIQTKRFREYEEELAYNRSKQEQDKAPEDVNPAPGTGFNVPDLDKKGK